MVIYSPVPAEFLLSPPAEDRQFKEIPYGEARILTEVVGEGVCKVVRLISSNPEDYLNPDLQPGCEVLFKPVL